MASDETPDRLLDARLATRLYQRAGASRWNIPEQRFRLALEDSAKRAPGVNPFSPGSAREMERYLESLHLEDLALACACADGSEAAWDQFMFEHRPVLYRAADALAPGGGAREIADALYAELYGLDDRGGERRSLFRYFHGRSSLATWLRAVLAQRYVDRVRSQRRTEPLAEEQAAAIPAVGTPDPDRTRFLSLVQPALSGAIARLTDRDRLRLGLYYRQQLTLAETGRVLAEHEATVSRQLAKTRSLIRKDVEHQLVQAGLSADEVARCFESIAEDPGPLDLGALIGPGGIVQADGR